MNNDSDKRLEINTEPDGHCQLVIVNCLPPFLTLNGKNGKYFQVVMDCKHIYRRPVPDFI